MPDINDLPEKLPPILQELVDYWRIVSDKVGRLPSLNDINLIDIYKIAPRIFIADRVEDSEDRIRYRWRYWGTTLCDFVGADLTGKFLDVTHDDKATSAAMKYYEWALENGKPHYFCQAIRVKESPNTYWDYERLIVPLEDKTGQPGHILGVYVSEHENKKFRPVRSRSQATPYSFRDN